MANADLDPVDVEAVGGDLEGLRKPFGFQILEFVVDDLDHPAHVGATAIGRQRHRYVERRDARVLARAVVEADGVVHPGDADSIELDSALVDLVLDVRQRHLTTPRGRCSQRCRFRGPVPR